MFTKTVLLFLSTLGLWLCHQIFDAVKFVKECYVTLAACPSFTTDVIDINIYNKINSASAQAAASLPFHLLLYRPHISFHFPFKPRLGFGIARTLLPSALPTLPTHLQVSSLSLHAWMLLTFANSLIRYKNNIFPKIRLEITKIYEHIKRRTLPTKLIFLKMVITSTVFLCLH